MCVVVAVGGLGHARQVGAALFAGLQTIHNRNLLTRDRDVVWFLCGGGGWVGGWVGGGWW
jgi:hypothetical protein